MPAWKLKREVRRVAHKIIALPATLRAMAIARSALFIAERDGWKASLPLWKRLSRIQAGHSLPFPQPEKLLRLTVTRDDRSSFENVFPQSQTAPSLRYCVYTVLLGDYDDLKSPVCDSGGIDFICFTDQDIDVPGWQIRKVPAYDGSPARQVKYFKFFPHIHLKDYEASLFVDASIVLHGPIDDFVSRWLAHEHFVMWRHPERCDAFAEAAAILMYGKAAVEDIVRQADSYSLAGLPKGSGLMEAPFIWRKHEDTEVQRLMSLWWDEVTKWSLRDQVSLSYLMWLTGVRPKALPSRLGDARLNPISFSMPHRPRRRIAAKSSKRIVFLYSEAFRSSGSTILRGQQLADIARTHFGDVYDVSFTSSADCNDAIVFLTKGFLKIANEDEVSAIKSKNIAVLADFVDDPVRRVLLPFVDLLLASSIEGWRTHLWRFQTTDSELLTHHVDLRIPADLAGKDEFSVGYFGEPTNALKTTKLETLVDFVHVDTRLSDPGWMQLLGNYNMHYAVRSSGGEEHTKPFLKGFTAAQCGANIIVGRMDGDARHYLGEDYPYLLDAAEPEAAAEMVRYARESFGGPEWRQGLETMRSIRERSNVRQVCTELDRILRRWA